MFCGLWLGFEPDPGHLFARAPFVGLGMAEAHHGAALRAHQILGGDADGPAQPRRLRDDLIERMHVLGSAYPRDRLHPGAVGEHLHPKGDGPQSQQPLQIGGEFADIGHASHRLRRR